MVDSRADLAVYRLERAEEDLKGAKVLLDNKLYKQSKKIKKPARRLMTLYK